MLDFISWWRSFRRNANFWDWVRDSYSAKELKELVDEATDASLIRPPDPFADRTWDQQQYDERVIRRTARRLMRRYGDDIWNACLGAGGYDPGKGRLGLVRIASLPLQHQVHNQASFEEFLVRNALRRAAIDLLDQNK